MTADLGKDGKRDLFGGGCADVEAGGSVDAGQIGFLYAEFGEEFFGAFVGAEDTDIGGGGWKDELQVAFVGVIIVGHQQDGGVVVDEGLLVVLFVDDGAVPAEFLCLVEEGVDVVAAAVGYD